MKFPLSREEFVRDGQDFVELDVVVGFDGRHDPLVVAKIAHRIAHSLFQVPVLQWTKWWSRDQLGIIRVSSVGALNLISSFAAAMPALPELRSGTQQRINDNSEASARRQVQLQSRTQDKPQDDSSLEGAASSRHAAIPTVETSSPSATDEKNSELMRALTNSRADTPLPRLSDDDVVLFRLTSCSTDTTKVLVDALIEQTDRVSSTGCEVLPEWANGALLLVPLTIEHMTEANLQLRAHNIMALRRDQAAIQDVLASLPKRRRPRLQPEHHAHEDQQTGDSYPLNASPAEVGGCRSDLSDFDNVQLIVERTFITFVERRSEDDAESRIIQSAPF